MENALLSKLKGAEGRVEEKAIALASSEARVAELETERVQQGAAITALTKQLQDANRCDLNGSRGAKISGLFFAMPVSSRHPIMYTTKLKIHVPVVPLVKTQLIKCLQAEQITFFPLMEGLDSCITCQIHDLLAPSPAAVLTIFTMTGVLFSE